MVKGDSAKFQRGKVDKPSTFKKGPTGIKGISPQTTKFFRPRTISGGGGGGRGRSVAGPTKADLQAEQARKQAEIQRQFEEKLKIEQARTAQRRADTEQDRISTLRTRLARENAQTRTRELVDRAGDAIRQDTIINRKGERIFTTTNLRTGEVDTRTFERKKGQRGVQLSGGISKSGGGFTAKEQTRRNTLNSKISDVNRKISRLKEGGITFNEKKEIEALERKKKKLQRQIKKGVTTGFVTSGDTAVTLIQKLNVLQRKASTKSIRKREKDIKNELKLLGLTVATTVVAGGIAFVTLPKTLLDVAKNPSQLLKIPSALKRGAEDFGQLLRVSPTEAFAKIGGEILFLKGSGATLRIIGKVGGKTATRLSPRFKKIQANKINLTSKGKTVTIKVGGSVKKIAEPLKSQARLAGKRVTAVSVQADRLVGFIKTKKIVRKPIPGEAQFSPKIKRLLKKFDSGKINRRELLQLEGSVPVLERSFFADPRGRFRPSRLGGKQKDASLLDVLSGDFTFKTSKPQILVFNNVKVAKFPKALKDVEKALKAGKTLTEAQGKRLLRFQSKKTGEFKPIGALSKEPEITLAPGEIIKRVKKAGVTLVNGKKVDIVFAKVIKAKPVTKKLLAKSKLGKLTNKELKQLRKNLKKETGFEPRLSRSTKLKARARLPKRVTRGRKRSAKARRTVRGKAVSRTTKRITKATRRGQVPKRAVKRVTGRTTTRPPKRPTKRPPKRPTKRPPKRPSGVPGKVPPKVVPRFKKKKVKKATIRKNGKKSFDVFAKPVKGKKLIKINEKPLSKTDAKNLRNFVVDTSLSRQGSVRPGKGKPKKAKIKVPKGFAKKTSSKFRRFKIRKGKRKPLSKGRVIEKRRNALDTKSERQKISLARRVKQLRKTARKKKPVKRNVVRRKPNNPKRKLTPQQKRVMLANLARARRSRGKSPTRSKTNIRKPGRASKPTKRTNNNALQQQRLRNLQKARMQKKLNQQSVKRTTSATRRTKFRRIISII